MKNLGRNSLFIVLLSTVALSFACASNELKQSQVSYENSANTASSTETATRKSGGGGGGNELKQKTKVDDRQTVSSDSDVKAEKISLDEPTQTVERKIIRNANLTLEVNAPAEVQQKLGSIAESKGGYITTSETQEKTYSETSKGAIINLTLRVPANQFDSAINEIRQNANRIIVEKITGQDVTEEFIDLEAHLKTKKALEAQFLEIMKQAKTVDDALSVQRELANVRGEIEQIEGRYKFLQNQTSFSTITITLQTPTPFAASSSGFGSQIGRAFSDGIDAALIVILALIRIFLALLPLAILFGIPLWLFVRYLRKKRQREKLVQELAKETKD